MNNNGIVSLQQSNLWIVQVAMVESIPNELFSDFRNYCLCCDKSNCFKTCSRCKSVNFCSVSCQRAVWKSHKKLCNLVATCFTTEQVASYEHVRDMMMV
jgi:hypothetical protein